MTATETRIHKTYMCLICGFIYDEAAGLPDEGIAPGTRWEDVPMNWTCPECGARKEDFEMVRDLMSTWNETRMRMLHTMIRVGDLQRSIDFYTQVLGMKLLRKTDYPAGASPTPSSATTTSRKPRCWSSPTTGTHQSYDLGTATATSRSRSTTPTRPARK